MINIFADINISTVCEEVVGGVLAGHKFGSRGLNKSSFIAPSKMTEFKTPMQPSSITKLEAQLTSPDVSVILDIKANNYFFTTQPGAIRRVIMNLLGNSLKYTSQGYVHIKLETEDIEGLYSKDGEHTPRSMVKLTIVDSGRGISNEFLRSKLFIPFAQENSLSSGTGLGLAIVKGIITSLGGMIAIDSEQGSGTRKSQQAPLHTAMTAPSSSRIPCLIVCNRSQGLIAIASEIASTHRFASHENNGFNKLRLR
jgi:signal transduction histidine kinase